MQKPNKAFYESIDKLSYEMAREHYRQSDGLVEEELEQNNEKEQIKDNSPSSNNNEQINNVVNFEPNSPKKNNNESIKENIIPIQDNNSTTVNNKPKINNSTTTTTINNQNVDENNKNTTTNNNIEVTIKPVETDNTSYEEDTLTNVPLFSIRSQNSRNKIRPLTFYEKSQRHKQQHDAEIESLKKKYLTREQKNYQSIPMINRKSINIIEKKSTYIPIWEKAVELQNQKKAKIMIEEQRKQALKEGIQVPRSKSNRKCNKKDIDNFIKEQFDWKEQIEYKKKSLQLLKRVKSQNDLRNNHKYIVYLDKNSNDIVKKKKEYNDPSDKLYKDYEIRENKLKVLQEKYKPSFMPNINQYKPRNKKAIVKSKSFYTTNVIENEKPKKRESSSNIQRTKSKGIPSRMNSGKVKINEKKKSNNNIAQLTHANSKISKPKSKYFSMNDINDNTKNIPTEEEKKNSSEKTVPIVSILKPVSKSNLNNITPPKQIPKPSEDSIANVFTDQKEESSLNVILVDKTPSNINSKNAVEVIKPIKPPSNKISSMNKSKKNVINLDIEMEEQQIKPYMYKERITTINKKNKDNDDSMEPSWINELQMLSNIPEKKEGIDNPINSLYMINTRNSSSTGMNAPITVIGRGPFAQFFKKS